MTIESSGRNVRVDDRLRQRAGAGFVVIRDAAGQRLMSLLYKRKGQGHGLIAPEL